MEEKAVTHQQIIDYCLKKPGAYEDYPFGPDSLAIKVKAPSREKGPIFTMPFVHRGHPVVTLRCTPQSAEFYRGIYPGAVLRGWHCPPVQQPHFNTVSSDGTVPDPELLQMIDHSYAVVVAKMPKYIQKELLEG